MTRLFARLGAASFLALCAGVQAQTQAGAPKPPAKPAVTAARQAQPVTAAPVHRAARHRLKPHKRSSSVVGVSLANRSATRQPVPAGFHNAVQVYPYSEGTLYQVYAAPERITDIALQAGEGLISVAAGDTARWVIGDTTSGSGADKRTHVLVKPFSGGLATNIVITTDRRSYHLALSATSATAMVALSWTYPEDSLIALRQGEQDQQAAAPIATGIAPDQLHFSYVISGDKPNWRPLRAFDDGRQTYIEFPASLAVGEAPPLFLVDRKGDAQLVNYRLRGRFYVVDRIFDAAELRLGLKKQDVVRIARVGGASRSKRS